MSTSAPIALAESWLELPDGRLFWLKSRCAIGRHPDNDLVFEAPSLSRQHALLASDVGGYTLSDLHSRNGTYLNGAAVTHPVLVRDADEIRVGDVMLRFRCTRQQQFAESNTTPAFLPTVHVDQLTERTCWLLLVDVVGFAALNESLGSEAALRRMQAWIAAIRPLIEGRGGRINGYLGDAIFAFWSCDAATPAQVTASLRAIEAWRPQSPLVFRVVAHHGTVLFTRSDRGEELSGQEVNFLFRSEKLAKKFNTSSILSEAAVQSLGLSTQCPALGRSAIDGMSGDFGFHGLPPDFAVTTVTGC